MLMFVHSAHKMLNIAVVNADIMKYVIVLWLCITTVYALTAFHGTLHMYLYV